MNLPMLFKKTKTGAVQQWSIWTIGSEVITEYGQTGGKLQQEVYVAEAKNVGRSNETSCEDQAKLEAKAKHVKQQDKGYVLDASGENALTLPPLAKKFQDFGVSIKWPAFVSCKYDGLRCTVFYKNKVVLFQSRGGKLYPVLQHIAQELVEKVFQYTPDVILDGELYCKGMHLEDITSACKTTKKPALREQIKFYVFDYLASKNDKSTLKDRVERMRNLPTHFSSKSVVVVSQAFIANDSVMLDIHKDCVEQGYEGVVIRNTDSVFEFNYRTSDFQKYKVAMDSEYKVVGMNKSKQGGVCVCEYFKPDGSSDTFNVNVKCTKEKKQELWDKQDEYIGKWLNVSFEKLSKYGKPTKGVGEYFRQCNDKGEPQE